MKTLIIVGIAVCLLLVAGFAVVKATQDNLLEDNLIASSVKCTSCGNSCSAEKNCGLSTCGAVNGGTCGCGK
jgi:hypothetical protein